MANAVEIANAYVSLTVKMPNVNKDVATALGAADSEFSKAGARSGSLFGKMVGANLIANLGADAIKGAVNGIVGFVSGSIDAYKEAEAAQVRLSDAMVRFPAAASVGIDALRGLNTELMNKTQFDDDALASGQAVLAQFGLTGQQLQEVTPLLADYAAKTKTDIPTAAEQLGKAMLGQGRALKAVGIDFVDTGTQAGNYAQLVAGLTTQVGGFAETQGQSFEGMKARMANAFGEIQESIGGALIPVLTTLGNTVLTNVMPAVLTAAGAIADGMGPALSGIVGFIGQIDWEPFLQLGSAVSPLGAAFQVLQPVLPVIADALSQLSDVLGGVLSTVLPTIGGLFADIGGILANTLAAVLPSVMSLVTSLAGVLSGALGAVLPVIADLFTDVATVVGELAAQLLPVLVPVLGQIGDVFGSVVAAVAPLIGTLADALMPVFEAIIPIIVQAAGMFAELAGTVLPVLTPIVQVLADVFGKVLAALMPVVTALVGALAPIVGALVPIIMSLLGAFMPLIQVLVEALAPILTTVADIISAVLVPVIDVIAGVLEVLAGTITWLVENVIVPMFTGTVVPAIQDMGSTFDWLYTNIIKPVWEGISAAIGAAWTWISENVFTPLKLGIDLLSQAFTMFWEDYVVPIWQGISDAIGAAWTWIDQNVFTPFKAGIDLIVQGFEVGAQAIGVAWDAIKGAAAVPINFVLDVIWNKGLRSFWNDVVSALGLNDLQLPEAQLVQFASGGVMPGYTPGRDVHMFWSPTGGALALSGGEAVMRPEFTRAVGGAAGVAALNSAARAGTLGGMFGGFADGGVLDFLGDVWSNVTQGAAVAWEFVTDPAGSIQKYIIDGIIDPLLGGAGDSMWAGLAGALPKKLMEDAASLFSGLFPAGAGGGPTMARVEALMRNFPGLRITSAYRSPAENAAAGGVPGSYHMDASNPAVDVAGPWDQMNAIAAAARAQGGWRELLWQVPGHYDHVHFARSGGVLPRLYDEGGWLPHGGVAVNMSGRPERVLSPAESAAAGGPVDLSAATVAALADVLAPLILRANGAEAARRGFYGGKGLL